MGVGPRFEATPSWRLSILMVVIVCVSYSVEKFFHWVDHKLAGHDEVTRLKHAGLIRSVHKLKEELMLLGVISMLVLFIEDTLAHACMPSTWMDPSEDSFVAANHPWASDKCRTSLYHKDYNTSRRHMQEAQQAAAQAQQAAAQALQWAIESHAPAHVLRTYQDALGGQGYRRQLGGIAKDATDKSCYATGQEEFISAAALHQAHILIFIIAFFHILYAVATMTMTLNVVKKLDRFEVWGDDEGEDASLLKPPGAGWGPAFCRNAARGTLSNPFTYMSLRNFFILKHGLRVDFPFDDYIHLVATDDFQTVVGMKWWMWLLLTCTVLVDGLNTTISFMWSILPMLVSLLVGTKVSKIAGDIAIKSYTLYDLNQDGKLSQEEVEVMQLRIMQGEVEAPGGASHANLANPAEASDATTASLPGSSPGQAAEVRSPTATTPRAGTWAEGAAAERAQHDNAAETAKRSLTDKHFWFGKPRFLRFLIQYIMFQNSMVFSMFVFNFWQIRGDCYLDLTVRLCRLAFGLIVLVHDSFVTLPTYAIVLELGDNYSKELLNATMSMVAQNQIEVSHVDRGLVGKGADVERQSQSAAAPPVEDILDELAASRANGATKLADDDATTPTTPESPHAADPPPIGGASMPGAMP